MFVLVFGSIILIGCFFDFVNCIDFDVGVDLYVYDFGFNEDFYDFGGDIDIGLGDFVGSGRSCVDFD